MKELKLEEIKKIELELLLQFHELCEKQKLRYSIGGGTLLGAVRHKGFIPWDDDIDVMMPRPDYDMFINYYNNNEKIIPFILHANEVDKKYIFLDSKISAPNTVIVDDSDSLNVDSSQIGVHIDVFAIDGLGDSEKNAINNFRKTSLKREVLNASAWKHFFRSRTHPIYFEPIRFIVYILSRFSNPQRLINKINNINRSINFSDSLYAGCVSGAYRKKEIMKSDVFCEYMDMKFENYSFKAIRQYDAYLKKHYGDYMKLPPKEKQVSHHSFKAYENEKE